MGLGLNYAPPSFRLTLSHAFDLKCPAAQMCPSASQWEAQIKQTQLVDEYETSNLYSA